MLSYLSSKNYITITYFWDGKYWIGQVKEHDITAQRDSFLECKIEMRSTLKKLYDESMKKYGIPFLHTPKSTYKYSILWRLASIKEVLTFATLKTEIATK
jgi:hypothetical protein